METNEIAIVYLAFTQSSGGKRRPVIVIDDFSKDLLCYPVTTKYAEKSTRIRKNYLEIVDWQAANLDKPSWIDVGTMYRLDKTLQMKIKKIGKLSVADIWRLAMFTREHESGM
ncbi:type II toxin-antitoxin system PemK/MazF family toxin [Levilactobacillus parabrevis]|uniref:type II toxin-antitoxin system PemK/MazF family toxin n=1 Tax=Levilactobacillus parabrevis TaxID=357278 RepID=UPI0003600264|nr:type II toxin-antitoxin system PemK/MazF family toxin [Levilactobacillus parabrevis]MCT4487921.1 toxin MazF [Levilactobacillus parabrevis]MCT4489323.1 toxin MazF [Levilactobacillus parabrevis]